MQELLDLGESVGTQSRGLSQDLINFVTTYVEHVMNICHLELTNLLTKHILLVIG